MKKFFSLIAAVLFAGSMMADVAELQYTGGVTTNMVGDSANNAATLGLDADLFTVLASKGSNQNLPGLNKNNDIRLYADKNTGNGNSITVSIANGTINSIVLDIKQSATFVVKAGDAVVTEADSAYAINASSFFIQNTTVGATTQLQLNKITINYTAEGGTPTVNYYVAGSMNGWGANEAYMLTPSNNGEYKGEFTFAANDEFKVIGVEGDSTTWYPGGTGNNFQITEAGDYKITFNPAGNVEGWHGGYFNVVMKEAPVAISCLEVYQLAKNDVVGLLNPVTVTYSNGANVWVMDGSASMLIYLPSGFTNNFQAGDTLSGISGVVDIYQNIVYEVKPDATQAAAIVATPGEAPAPSQAAVIEASDVNKYVILPGFSIEGAFTADSKTSLPAALGTDTVTIYNNFKFAYTFEAGKTYDIIGVVSAYRGNPQVYFISAVEAGTPIIGGPSYYVAGSMNNWSANAAYKLAANPANEGEYKGEFTFAANDEFKVIGVEGDSTTWYPGGVDNNFVINQAGTYNIFFRPEGGVEGWYEGYFHVMLKEEPVLPDPTNCAEAREAALSVSDNNVLYKDSAVYTIEGYVTAIATDFNPQFNNVSFWMADAVNGGNVIQAFRAACASAEEAPAIGDKVAVTGCLTKYNSTPEFAAGCTYVITEKTQIVPQNLGAKTIAEFLELKNTIDTCILTGVVDSIANTVYGNLYLTDETATVYVYGVLTPDGASKQFESLDVAVGDELTIKAIYSEYNNAPQVKNAIFVSREKKLAIDNTSVEVKATKVIENGKLVIIKNGVRYDAQGARL